jgi:hypothetical protein
MEVVIGKEQLMFVVFFALVGVCGCVPMGSFEFGSLREYLAQVGAVAMFANTTDEVREWHAAGVFSVPQCPGVFRGPYSEFHCDGDGTLTFLSVKNTPVDRQRADDVFPLSSPATLEIVGINFRGVGLARQVTTLVMRDVFAIGVTAFLFEQVENLTLSNVTFPDFDWSEKVIVASAVKSLRHCSIRDARLKSCSLSPLLSFCFNSPPASRPLCDVAPAVLSEGRQCTGGSFREACSSCTPAPVSGACAPGFKPVVRGLASVEITERYPDIAEAVSVRPRNIVARIDVFNWATLNWTTVLERETTRPSNPEVDEHFSFHRIVTNRIRLTLDMFLQTDQLLAVTIVSNSSQLPTLMGTCAAPLSLSLRSILDETSGDSLCINRLCQSPCSNRASFTFERAVKAEFLVIEGGGVWTDGQLVMTPSDRTRVYKLDGRVTAFVNVTGVGNTERVRLVGEPVNFALPAPTVPNRLGLPGVFVKTYRSTAPTGGVTLSVGDGGGLVAPNGTVASVARVQNQTFAATDDGAIWQVNGTLWTALSGFTSLILNANEKAPARRLVAVGDRLVVVVAANTKVHDGSREPLLVNRLMIQTPIDALDVQTGVWYNRLLDHGIAKNVSDVDVVRWNATAFAVVDRATREAAVFEWRPFPYALVPCSAGTDCRACLTNEASEELCQWCGTRCLSRNATCNFAELTVVNASNVLCTGPTTTAPFTTTTTTAATTKTTRLATTAATSARSTVASASAVSSVTLNVQAADDSLTIGLAVGIPIALLALLGVGAALWCVFARRRQSSASVSAASPAVELPGKDTDKAETGEEDSLGVSISDSE